MIHEIVVHPGTPCGCVMALGCACQRSLSGHHARAPIKLPPYLRGANQHATPDWRCLKLRVSDCFSLGLAGISDVPEFGIEMVAQPVTEQVQ